MCEPLNNVKLSGQGRLYQGFLEIASPQGCRFHVQLKNPPVDDCRFGHLGFYAVFSAR
jgi:hypothetical protein